MLPKNIARELFQAMWKGMDQFAMYHDAGHITKMCEHRDIVYNEEEHTLSVRVNELVYVFRLELQLPK